MARKTYTLVDAEKNLHEGSWQLGQDESGSDARYSVRKSTLHGGAREGVEIIEVDNGTFRFIVVPTRGMGVWRAWLGDLEVGWKSPVRGPIHPQFVALTESSGLGWLDGFDELLVRCGLESNGAPVFDEQTGRLQYPLHGKIANKPAHFVEVTVNDAEGEISVSGIVDEYRFHFGKLRLKTTITTKVGEKGFRVADEVTNMGGDAAGMQMLYHINFGPPLLDAGAKIVAPVKAMVPRDAGAAEAAATWDSYPAPQRGFSEQVYFFDLAAGSDGQTQVLLKNAHSLQGISLKYPVKQLPCFTLWKDTMALEDGYVTGLEPGTNFPNPRPFEESQNRVVKLEPGESRKFQVGLEVHADEASVSNAEKAIAQLQAAVTPRIYDKPQSGWSQI